MRRTLTLVLLFLFTINIGCTHTPTKKLSTDKTTENTQALDDKQPSSSANNLSDTTHALADLDNKTLAETPTPADTSTQAATYPKPTPASFSGSPEKYCALRQLHIVNMVNNRDRGIKRGQIHKIISDKVAPKGRENEKTLAHNAAFLAYEMPKLSRKTLQSVDSLQCGKFVRTKSEKSAVQLVSMAPALLACQNDFKNHAEHIQCLSMILFSDDLCKLFDRSCPGNQAQQPKQIDASLTTQTMMPPAQRDNMPCTCTRNFSEKTHNLLEQNGINQAAFDSLTRVDPLVEQLYAHDDEANYLEVPVKGVLLSVQPKLGNTITKFLNRSLPAHNLRAVLYDNNYRVSRNNITMI